MITITADAPPRPLTVRITCDGPAMLGVLPAFCAGSLEVTVTGFGPMWATETAKQHAREKGWTRREPRDGHDFWVCPECGR